VGGNSGRPFIIHALWMALEQALLALCKVEQVYISVHHVVARVSAVMLYASTLYTSRLNSAAFSMYFKYSS